MGIKSINTPTGSIEIEEDFGFTLADDKTIRDKAAAFLGENRAWARANQDKIGAANDKDNDKEPKKDKRGR